MFELLITKSTTYAAKTGGGVITGIDQIDLLADGAMAVFTDRNEMVTAANVSTIFENRRGFYIAVGGDGVTRLGTQLSTVIDRLTIENYTKKDYVAPAKQVIICGVGATAGNHGMGSSVTAGDVAYLRIVDNSNAIIPPERIERYEYVVQVGDTPADVITALVAKINARVGGIGTAAVHGSPVDGFAFTLADYYKTAEILCDGIIAGMTVDYTVVANGVVVISYGVGTPAYVSALEEEWSSIQFGNTNKVYQSNLWFSRLKATDTSATYDMYSLAYMKTKYGATKKQDVVLQEVILAMPHSATQQSTFQTIMAAALVQENALFNGIES